MSKEINYNEEKKEFEIKKFDLSGHIHLKNFLIILLCFGITFLFFYFAIRTLFCMCLTTIQTKIGI